jgi:hypothetical protein
MSLRDLVDRKTTISDEKTGIEFEVRGLSLQDIVLLLENHKDALVRVFAADDDGTDFQQLIQEFPGFIAAAIAYSADEYELEETVVKMPVGLQLKAIQEVWELSSLDVETVGKLAESLLASVSKLNAANLQHLKTDLMSGANPSQAVQNS